MGLCRPMVATVLMAVCGLAGAAAAQQYRGDGGTLLDRNLQVGSGGKNVRARDVRDQIWFNNQIITGNAPGGKSFRGYVGYTSPSQFRGATGTDSQFQFLRDSASSGKVSTGVRTSDALRYQMSLTTGQSAPGYLAASTFTSRGSNAATAGAVTTSSEAALRSTAAFMTARSLRPTLMAQAEDKIRGGGTIAASNLLGVTFIPDQSTTNTRPAGEISPPITPGAPRPAAPAGTSVTSGAPGLPGATSVTPGAPQRPEAAATPRPTGVIPSGLESRGPGFRDRWDAANRGTDNSAGSGADRGLNTAVESTAVPSRSAAHQRMMDELGAGRQTPPAAARPATPATPGAEPETDRPQNVMDVELERIRRVLQGQSPLPPPAKPDTTKPTPPAGQPESGEDDSRLPSGPRTGESSKDRDRKQDDKDKDDKGKRDDRKKDDSRLSSDALRAIRGLGDDKLESLTSTTTGTGPADPAMYRRQMDAGQTLLAEGRYFDAEDRFTRAIAALPADPLAKAARVHAQLGAGLYLSASTNLRRLIQNNPEVVGLRFDRKLTLSAERAQVVARQLREEIDRGSTGIGLEASLLLAYLGRITEDQAVMEEGLTAMSQRLPKDDDAEAALYLLLRGVWTPAPEPAPAK